ncbi:NeuD/PglB/VioB family sugar acetyltransferase [Flavobacterium sandaracinum]|uniref:Sugar O-acyltransferase n=1 Tax=Flavobacterium sandaracinum TaxID=2541733 RepID=A0A4R5D4Y9_9FLAO|nr:NeuD/PglB/VioB family sugar acetyltransferase [Flavobacterium sandaracinum]TDE07567.1 sugar O-acyltransferase [Flavobacterium sandaracinum]
MQNLIIIGAGGLGRETLQWAKDINKNNLQWNILGFIDDNQNALEGCKCSHPIIGTIKNWTPKKEEVFICAIAAPQLKEQMVVLLKNKGAKFTNIIHPTAIIGDENEIGEGLIMYPFSRITVNTRIGNFVTLLSSGVGHDAEIGDYSTIFSGCLITGGAILGKRVTVSSNSVIISHKNVGNDAFIGAGSVVMRTVEVNDRVMGNPARKFVPKI